MDEVRARQILQAAIWEDRASELLDCLFDGGACSVDGEGRLILVGPEQIQGLLGR